MPTRYMFVFMLTIEEIRTAVAENAPGSWVAGETSAWRRGGVAGSSSGMFGLRLGDATGVLKASAGDAMDELGLPAPPSSIDWREKDGGRLSDVRDQDTCNACVAFATATIVESDNWIRTGALEPLSEAELFHCNGGSCEDGWDLASGLDAATGGMAALGGAPWSVAPLCLGVDNAVKVTAYAERWTTAARKRAVSVGPVIGGMRIYEDFLAYESGVYQHVVGDFVLLHAICIVGYDDDQGIWIVRNSWGPGFGENGYFRIPYGACGFDEFPFYSCETEQVLHGSDS